MDPELFLDFFQGKDQHINTGTHATNVCFTHSNLMQMKEEEIINVIIDS